MLTRLMFRVSLILPAMCASCSTNQSVDGPKDGAAPAIAVTQPDPLSWPRRFTEEGNEFVIYQPQIDKWEANWLVARSAVSVTPAGKADPSYGMIALTARTDVDKSDGMVTLDDIQFVQASFPQSKEMEAKYLAILRQQVPTATREVPLEHLEANLAAAESARQAAAVVDVKNDPPQILFASTPSILILIDGEPVLQQVGGAEDGRIMRVVNTRALILLDEGTTTYYLHLMNQWVSSKTPVGPWSAATAPPPALDKIKASLAEAGTVDALNPDPQAPALKVFPTIYVSTTPTELIQTNGAAEFISVPGTDLLYVKNTDTALFKHLKTRNFYVLISGRWFAAAELKGPWTFLPGKSLPPDFTKIPTDSPKANVLVSIPTTPEAQEAVIANSIPQTATVNIAETKLVVSYDGQPKFRSIAGTTGLSYATNTVLPVLQLDADRSCWCVQNGVWFRAPAPVGPWAVATEVPGVLYTIPVSSPLHYVTYVRIYGSAPGVVYVGYTPGYMGTCVSSDGVVVYGTGYYYPAYVGTVWVGYPPTYGYGAGFSSGAVSGFAFGFAAGAVIGNAWSSPHWGPYYHRHSYGYRYSNVDINTTNVYRNSRGGVTTVNRKANWETGEGGNAKRTATNFNPYTGRASAAGGKINMDDDGDFVAKRGAASYDPNTGIIRAGGSKTTGDLEDGDFSRKTGQGYYNTKTDTGVARKGNDVYVAKDGDIYRHDNDKGWQQKTNDGWSKASQGSTATARTQDLDRQRQSRSVGQQRYESSRSASTTSRGGASGSRGGGGRSGRR